MSFFIRRNKEKFVNRLKRGCFERYEKVSNCSSLLYVIEHINKLTGETLIKPSGFYRCKECVCPICNDLKMYNMRKEAIVIVKNMEKINAVFITLSPCRIEVKYIKDMIRFLRELFTKIKNSKFFSKRVKGYITSIEFGSVTSEKYIHVHLHAIISVSGSVKGRNFISNNEFSEFACDIFYKIIEEEKFLPYSIDKILSKNCDYKKDYEIQTNIQSITNRSTLEKKINYITKSKNLEYIILSLDVQSLKTFINKIPNIKYITRGGIFSKKNSKQKLSTADFAADDKNCYLLSREETQKYIKNNKDQFSLWGRADTFYS
ncbi:protein rep [Mailhella massiliensis]|uniref:protein rep n=1 Tax=Mailhella massiliensis TaxID=1903261 RepID=UPI002357EDBF|nr:protein rep [Mailhella massiliensis]